MFSIYIYEGPFKQGEKGYDLIREAAARFCAENHLEIDVYSADILKREKGKPYFDGTGLEFSLSHSGLLWMCLIGTSQCGLDIQEVKECKYEEIAKRYFTKEEQHYVELWGIEGFFEIWVRKEAFGKFTGIGLFAEGANFISEKGDILDQLQIDEKTLFLTPIEISNEIKCVVCTEEKVNVEVRILA